MPKNKPNPLLARWEAQKEAEYKQRLEINSEFDLLALMMTVNQVLGVGPGRAGKVLAEFMVNKVKIAEAIDEDYGPDKHSGDKNILHTKRDLARRMKSILSPEDWDYWKHWFPLLRDFWEE